MSVNLLLPIGLVLASLGISNAHDATYYTEYTNASTQVSLTLSPASVHYWDGSSVALQAAAFAYPYGRVSPGPTVTLTLNCQINGVHHSTLPIPWGPYSAGLATNFIALLDLPEGTHTITVEHTNRFEFNTETIYSHTSTHTSWGRTYYHTYFNRFHYFALPCSASQTLTVHPSPHFRRLLMSRTNDTFMFTFTGIPTNNYGLYTSFDLVNWHLHSVHKTATNGLAQFFDGLQPGSRFYRVFGP